MTKEKFIDKCLEIGYEWQEGHALEGPHKGKAGLFLRKGTSGFHFTDEGIAKLDEESFPKAVPNVSHMTRIVGYYSKVHNWNQSKIGELRDRRAGNYKSETEFKGKGKVYGMGKSS